MCVCVCVGWGVGADLGKIPTFSRFFSLLTSLSQIDGRSDGTVRRENLGTEHIEARIWDSPRYRVFLIL